MNIPISNRSYQFSLKTIAFIELLPRKQAAWIIGDQLIRSGTSIGANITEASAASSRIEFKRYYEIALKSANETIYWLNLLKDSNLMNSIIIEPLIIEVSEISKILGRSIISLKIKI